MRIASVFVAFGLSLLVCALAPRSAWPDDDSVRPPNIVLVFTDDQGYGDLGVQGAEGFETPHLDRLAAEGMRFTSFYVSEATCSASRASLLTGCYAQRVSMPGALSPHARVGLHTDEETIAELLQARGYATAAVGKWHLGHRLPFLPTQQGFDEWLGLPYSNDMWPVGYDGVRAERGRKHSYPELPLMDGTETVAEIKTPADQDTLTTRYTERAISFIERNRERPFFLYVAHSMPHVPLGVSERFRGESAQGLYGDVIMELDDSVGQVLAALDRYGLADETLVIFVSDNGPWLNFGNHAGTTGGLREGKGTAWEGGARVPCILRWPGHVPAGVVTDELAATIDLLPTIAQITGAALPKRPIDGVSLAGFLTGKEATSPRTTYLYYYTGSLCAVRAGRHKLVLPHSARSYVGVEPGKDGLPGPTARWQGGPLLFDLARDPAETTDLLPEVALGFRDPGLSLTALRLFGLARSAREELGDRREGVSGRAVRPIGRVGSAASKRVAHHARGAPITLRVPPSPIYAGAGASSLVDGVLGTADFADAAWIGFEGEDLEAVIDLGAPRRLDRVVCSFLESQASWIFLPGSVEVAVSSGHGPYVPVGRQSTPAPTQRPNASRRAFRFDLEGRTARYVRVRAANQGVCPDGHAGAGGTTWIFADEIVVR